MNNPPYSNFFDMLKQLANDTVKHTKGTPEEEGAKFVCDLTNVICELMNRPENISNMELALKRMNYLCKGVEWLMGVTAAIQYGAQTKEKEEEYYKSLEDGAKVVSDFIAYGIKLHRERLHDQDNSTRH